MTSLEWQLKLETCVSEQNYGYYCELLLRHIFTDQYDDMIDEPEGAD